MKNVLDKLERRIGRYAIKNLIVYLLIGYGIGYVIALVKPDILAYLTLEPWFIFKQGQIWRLISWVIIPPGGGLSGLSLIFAVIMIFFYYQLGRTLEQTWGSFRFNVYIFGGMLLTIVGALVLHLCYTLAYGGDYVLVTGTIGSLFSTVYINQSIFLAFAVMYPDMRVMLYFIIPIKMKWMAIFYAVILVIDLVVDIRYGAWGGIVARVASVANFLIFFFSTRKSGRMRMGGMNRGQEFRRQYYSAQQGPYRAGPAGGAERERAGGPQTIRPGVTRHRCAVCGRTDESNPELEFRFCSRCNGNYEYCQDHLFTHTHVS